MEKQRLTRPGAGPDAQAAQPQRIGTGMLVVGWLIFMVLAGLFFDDLLGKQQNPNQRPDTLYGEGGVREVVLKRNKYGHYVTSGQINGQPVVFMLDTGATGIAIPAHIASELQLEPGRAFPTRTANGDTISYATWLDSVGVGEIVIDEVRAAITPGLLGDEILLGMSFLRQIEFAQRGDTLVLRQYP